MKLSRNFTLAEMVRSNTATRKEIDNTPNAIQIENLRSLCENILQPLRDALGTPIRITSGFRCEILNTEIGGSKTSDHMEGKAADIDVPGKTTMEVAQLIVDLDLPFDQLINEFQSWVHVSYTEDGRVQILTAKKRNGRTVYVFGLVAGEKA